MALNFGTSVAINNLLALRGFYTFLFNYSLHERPSFIERTFLPYLASWVEKRAMSTLKELLTSENAKTASVSLNDVSGDFFAVLYIVQNQQLITDLSSGKELFILMAQMALEFEKVRKPRNAAEYSGPQQA